MSEIGHFLLGYLFGFASVALSLWVGSRLRILTGPQSTAESPRAPWRRAPRELPTVLDDAWEYELEQKLENDAKP